MSHQDIPDDIRDRHPATQHLIQYFSFYHLPQYLQDVSRPFAMLANKVINNTPDGPELTAGLRKLLEAKDCIVRAAVTAHAEEAAR